MPKAIINTISHLHQNWQVVHGPISRNNEQIAFSLDYCFKMLANS